MEWQGYVEEIREGEFIASLVTDTWDTARVFIYIHTSALTEEARDELTVGLPFRLILDDDGGTYEIQLIKETWTEEEIEAAKVRAAEIADLFKETE